MPEEGTAKDEDFNLWARSASTSSFPGGFKGSWGRKGCVQYNIFGPWSSQKWQRDIMAFMVGDLCLV